MTARTGPFIVDYRISPIASYALFNVGAAAAAAFSAPAASIASSAARSSLSDT